MNLESFGNVGEFIGGLAVIATLVYLAVQIRQNTITTRMSTLHASMDSTQNIFDVPARDAELTRIIRVGLRDPSQLTEDENARLNWWVSLVLRAMENTFVQHQAGMLDEQSWIARAHSMSNFISAPAVIEIWRPVSLDYREDFRDWISSVLDQKKNTTFRGSVQH